MIRHFENEGFFFLVQEAEKTQKIGDAKRRPKIFF